MLVFDTETTTDKEQSLNFGAYRFCKLDSDGKYRCHEEGFFYRDDVDRKSLQILSDFQKHTPETVEDSSDELQLYSHSEFIKEVLWKSVQAGAMLVGFNLPFDLSRVAVQWSTADNGGWSFIYSLQTSNKTGEIEPNPDRPRITVKSKDSKSAFISLVKPRKPKEWPRGRFLDLRTLAWSLRSQSYSLERACKEFNVPGKLKHEPTGRITLPEIEYCRQDVRATTDLLNAIKEEFDLHPIQLDPDRAFSPASIAKAYLKSMNVKPPAEKFAVSDQVLGIAMQSFYAGRAEIRIRHVPVPVVHTDFMSQYPTVNALLGNWNVLTAESLTFDDATEEIKKLVAETSLEDAFTQEFWKKLSFFALVLPEKDIFPVRTLYNGQTRNIGINYLTSEKPIWFAGPDLIASVLLSGKIPKIEKAIRMVAHGRQSELKSTTLRGMTAISPETDDFFKYVIEQRKLNEKEKSLAYFLKILANSGSYGLFVELSSEQLSKSANIKVFSGEEEFGQASHTTEKQGRWYFPPIASLITAGGRLLLAMLERCVRDKGGTYLFCDTDSLCIVSSKSGGDVLCPVGANNTREREQFTKALSWTEVDSIADRFSTLNPYDRNIVPYSILNIVKINKDSSGQRRQLHGYAISAKRYALYELSESELLIVDPKAHGLGYLYPPKAKTSEDDKDWSFEAWEWLLRKVHGMRSEAPNWLELPAMMRLVLSTPHVLRRFNNAIPPLNFLLCPVIDTVAGYPANVDPKRFTLIAPFTPKRDRWLNLKCVDVHGGRAYRLSLQQTSNLDRVIPQTYGYILRQYSAHPESKSIGPDGQPCTADTHGLLRRTSITAGQPRYLGKETDTRWAAGEDISLLEFEATEYRKSSGMIVADKLTREKIPQYGKRRLMRETGLSQHTIEAIQAGRPIRPRTLAILKHAIDSTVSK